MMKKTRFIGVMLAAVMAVTCVPQVAEPLTVTASAASLLAAPKNIAVEPNGTTATVTWKKVSGASAYRVYLYNATTKKYETYKNVSSATCKITGLTNNKTYKIKVAALVKSGSSYTVQTKSDIITFKALLAAPTGISASVADTTAKVTWNKVSGASAYRVYLYNATTKKFETYKNVSSPVCKFSGLTAGKTYKIKIAALVKSGSSYAVQTVTSQKSFTTKLAAPKSFKATVSGTSIKLTWKKVTGASGYRILIYDSVTKKFKTYKTISGTKFTFNNLPAGTYKFRVCAVIKKSGKLDSQVQTSTVTAKLNSSSANANKVAAAQEHVSGYRYGTTKYAIKHDLAYMRKLNTDFIGWLTIKDTPIDIPVVQATDNKFYLTHDFYGAYDPTKVGTTFADYHVQVTKTQRPDNLIIYGHNIRTGVGLAKITNYYPARYGSLKFYTTHPTFTYESVFGGTSTYVVFAGMFVNTENKHGEVFNYYKFRNFSSQDKFYQYFEQVFDRSVFYNPDIDIKYGDKFLTLSTCFYPFGADIDTRFVVFARQLRSGEKSISTVNAYINSSPKYFDYYYKVNGGKWAGRKWSESLMQGYSAWKKKNA